jgi:hypothetical protein
MNKKIAYLLLASMAFSFTLGCKPVSEISTPTPAPTQPTEPTYWVPTVGDRLQIQYADYPPDTAIEADVYALDLFETPQASIDQLHAAGKKVICYLNTGSWEEYRPDAGDFPAEVIGNDYEGWAGEKWLDTRNYELFADIMQARFDLAKSKGCDGIDADNMQNDQEETGFAISAEDQRMYLIWLSRQAHQRGMSIGLKNVPEQAEELLGYFDWSLIEDCTVYDWCELLEPFVEAGKPVFQVEYTDSFNSTDEFCSQARQNGYSAFLKNRELGAWVTYCP